MGKILTAKSPIKTRLYTEDDDDDDDEVKQIEKYMKITLELGKK